MNKYNKDLQPIVGYFPVINRGYLDFINQRKASVVAVLSREVLQNRFSYLRKDIRALHPEQAADIFTGMGRTARVIGEEALAETIRTPSILMPDDDISSSLLEEFPNESAILSPTFLRWDRKSSVTNVEVTPDDTITLDSDSIVLQSLISEAEMSKSWWRQVAAVIVDKGTIIDQAHNTTLPTSFSAAIDGDPSITRHRGESIETTIDIHAEAKLISNAARDGVSLLGKSIFITTFPCPTCAKLISQSGIETCNFIEGYASLDGEAVLRSSSVRLVKIVTNTTQEATRLRSITYPDK